MQMFASRQLRMVGRTIAATLVALALLFALWAWSGIYSVAASRGHWPIVEWLLTFVMANSVKSHALGIEVPRLDGDNQLLLGAGHFHSECASCHGAPGITVNAVAQQMLPPPPPLENVVKQWKDRELFWIIKNGIKYTGMPAFPSLERDDEIWAVTAFVKQLPEITPERYRQLVFGNLPGVAQQGRDIARAGTTEEAIGACARCHGMDDQGPRSKLVPVLHGQSLEYLLAAVKAYADGTRQSGVMQPAAKALSDSATRKVAEYYANLKRPSSVRDRAIAPHRIEAAREIATRGDPANALPSCMGCHGNSALAAFPRLAGQNADYMAVKLRLWKDGLEARSPNAEIMQPIARRLTHEQIDELSAYFAQLSPDEQRQ
jgi:cytochrome c553